MKSLFVTMFGVLFLVWNFANVVAERNLPRPSVSLGLPVNAQFDEIFADLRSLVLEKGLDPFNLPTDSDNFTATIFNSTLEGSVWVGNGNIKGLSTIHRTGNMKLSVNPLKYSVKVQGHVGFTDLEGHYETSFHLGPFRSRFEVSIHITTVSANLKLDASLKRPYAIKVLECGIDELRTLRVELRGLGLLDSRFYSLLVNAFTQILQPILQEALQKVACGLLQNTFANTL